MKKNFLVFLFVCVIVFLFSFFSFGEVKAQGSCCVRKDDGTLHLCVSAGSGKTTCPSGQVWQDVSDESKMCCIKKLETGDDYKDCSYVEPGGKCEGAETTECMCSEEISCAGDACSTYCPCGQGKYKTQLVKCVDKVTYCGSVFPNKDDNSIKWEGVGSVEMNLGEKKSYTIIANPAIADSDKNIIELKCENCQKEGVIIEVGNPTPTNLGKSLTLLINTGASAVIDNQTINASTPINLKLNFLAKRADGKSGSATLLVAIKLSSCDIFNSGETDCRSNGLCFWLNNKCASRFDNSLCTGLSSAEGKKFCGTEMGTDSSACTWKEEASGGRCLPTKQAGLTSEYGRPSGYEGPLPDCAFDGSCDNVNDLLQLIVNTGAKLALPLIGGFAFVMFLYGGFMMITSFGSAERVKKGQQILVAAVIGMVITVSAYFVVSFMLDIMGVKDTFRGIK